MASTDALPVPRKNVAFRLYAAVLDADGDLVTGGLTGMDSEISKDGGNFADCTNEFTEIQTSGYGYLDLTSTEMNADNVCIQIKVTNSGAKNPVIIMYPEEAGDMRADVVWWAGTAITFSTLGVASIGILDAGSAGGFTLPSGQRANVAAGMAIWVPGKGQPRLIASGYNSTTGVGTVDSNFSTAAAASDPYVVLTIPATPVTAPEVNVVQVNDVTLTGDGSATPWGPA